MTYFSTIWRYSRQNKTTHEVGKTLFVKLSDIVVYNSVSYREGKYVPIHVHTYMHTQIPVHTDTRFSLLRYTFLEIN